MLRPILVVITCLTLGCDGRRAQVAKEPPQSSRENTIAHLLLANTPSGLARSAQVSPRVQSRASSPVAEFKLLSGLENAGLLKKVAKSGILSTVEKQGVLSSLESQGGISKAAKLLPTVEKLGLLTQLEDLVEIGPETLALLSGPLIGFAPFINLAAVVIFPDNKDLFAFLETGPISALSILSFLGGLFFIFLSQAVALIRPFQAPR
mmetsp:Transcript_21131/g.33719  ORF Transcript_21131/g.33719 Transcript_21131/m.33719 type:complete len:207 (+) Transcript_21131:62-682(+)